MSVLLTPLTVAVSHVDGTDDEHGWTVPPATPTTTWTGPGNVREQQPTGDRTMASGGSGPHLPAVLGLAVAYLPTDCPVVEGDTLTVGDRSWLVGGARVSVDPTGTGMLDCIVVDLLDAQRESDGGDLP